jgi:hypothetical protein
MLNLCLANLPGQRAVNQSNSDLSYWYHMQHRYTLSFIAVAIVVLGQAIGSFLPGAAAGGNKPASGGPCGLVPGPASKRPRVLSFPKDYSLGELLVLSNPPDKKDQGVRGAARGTIVVPPGKLAKFIPGPRFYKNPSIINTLPPDGIDSIEFAASSLDDSEDGLCDRALSYVGHLKGLVELNLDRSDATDAGAVHAADLPNLQKITGLAAALEGKCFKQFSGLKQLRCVHLPRNCLKDDYLQYLACLPNLNHLSIGHCNLSDAGVKNLANCINLTLLNIGDNPKITDQSIKYLLCMKKLRELTIHDTSISPIGILQLKSLPLERLELPSKYYTQAQLEAITNAFPGAIISGPDSKKKPVDSDTRAIFAPLH